MFITALLKADSITDSFTAIYKKPEDLKNTDSVTYFKNILQANHKDIQNSIPEAFLFCQL